MPSSPSNGSDTPSGAQAPAGESSSRGQTVRAWNPLAECPPPTEPATEGTVKAPIPTAPKPMVGSLAPPPKLPHDIDTLEVKPIKLPPVDASKLIESGEGVPVSRSNAPTVPEEMAKDEPPEPVVVRVEPPAVSGEVSISDPEPVGMFDPRPQPRARPQTEPAGQVQPIREDPPAVSGEVAITVSDAAEPEPVPPPQPEVSVMTASGPQPVLTPSAMTSSGHHPVLNPAAFGQRPGTDPGSHVGVAYSDTTGPQPVAQAETTGPQAVLRASMTQRARPDRTLWYVALALVLLAVGGVVLVVLRAS